METIRIGIAAGPAALRAGLQALLGEEPEVEVVAVHPSLADFFNESVELLVWVPDRRDTTSLSNLLDAIKEVRLLVLVNEQADLAPLAGRFGANPVGVLPVEASMEEIRAVMAALSEGLAAGDPNLLAFLLAKQAFPQMEDELPEPLTARELEVLQKLAGGLTNKQVAYTLGISEHTAKFHISSIYAKLGVMNRAEAVQVGIRRGLIVV